MKKYIKDNDKLFKFINSNKYKILDIRPIKKTKNGFLENTYISSYCIIYEKML